MLAVNQLLDLSGKVAIVTGAAKGIGEGIALRLAEAGASVLVADLDREGAERVVNQIRARGGAAELILSDSSVRTDAEVDVETAIERFGSIDILVNNAGIFPFSPALETSEELWDRVIAVNLRGPFFYSQAAAAKMVELGIRGRIVNIASIDALHPTGNLAHYDASKAGLAMLTKSLALEFARYGITVNAIAPGAIDTPGASAVRTSAGVASNIDSDAMIAAFLSRVPLGRMGTPDDIAKAVLFFASPLADYVTGSLLVADGGYLLS